MKSNVDGALKFTGSSKENFSYGLILAQSRIDDSFLNIDTHIGYLMIGIILYFSCCCFRGLNREGRGRGLNGRLTQRQIVSPRIVEKIKNNTVDPNVLSKGSSCSICLEDFDETKHIVYLDCQHIYHEDCIIEWINKDPSCPLCRTNSLV